MESIDEINKKAQYCLNCKIKPCSNKGCPLGNNIPDFINAIKNEDYKKAYQILSLTTVLPGVCGRICPHKKQCQGSCVRGIKGTPVSIGDLEAFVFDMAVKNKINLSDVFLDKEKNMQQKKVAVIGGGPAGLTCAAFLAKKGVDVTIYEKYNYLGGLLVHGIPEFRLPKDIVKETVNRILSLGINVKYNMELNKNLILQDLEKQYDAIFLSFGANISSKMGVEGENLSGLFLEICGSCQNYIGLCRYVQGEKEPEGHCDCSQCGTWNERRFIGQNAVSSGWLCKGDRRNDSGRLCESSGGFRWNGISGRNGRT